MQILFGRTIKEFIHFHPIPKDRWPKRSVYINQKRTSYQRNRPKKVSWAILLLHLFCSNVNSYVAFNRATNHSTLTIATMTSALTRATDTTKEKICLSRVRQGIAMVGRDAKQPFTCSRSSKSAFIIFFLIEVHWRKPARYFQLIFAISPRTILASFFATFVCGKLIDVLLYTLPDSLNFEIRPHLPFDRTVHEYEPQQPHSYAANLQIASLNVSILSAQSHCSGVPDHWVVYFKLSCDS